MLHKCANTTCCNRFRKLSEGKLFQVETEYFDPPKVQKIRPGKNARPLHRIEHYWLCNECSSFLTLTFEKGQGMITIPLPGALGKKTVRAFGFEDKDTSLQEALVAASRRSY